MRGGVTNRQISTVYVAVFQDPLLPQNSLARGQEGSGIVAPRGHQQEVCLFYLASLDNKVLKSVELSIGKHLECGKRHLL